MFFDSWSEVIRVPLIGSLAYAGLIFLLRISGNRTLSKMNSFDFVVTVAFGSTLATILLNKDVSLADGMSALALLVLLQFIITWLSVRSNVVSKFIKTAPSVLVKDGEFLREAMKKVRVTESEIHAAARQRGIGGVELIAAVVMETDGSLSVISYDQRGSASAMKDIMNRNNS
jgi:uncharacterized membrane protein YcaP (DUF421 family)